MASSDPTQIRVLVVTTGDIVSALEANERRNAGAVLRVTPPFSGRMRARLHIEGAESEYTDPGPIHIPPERFVEVVPPFPNPDATEDQLRDNPATDYSPETHRTLHKEEVERWRSTLRSTILSRTSITIPRGEHEVRIATLG